MAIASALVLGYKSFLSSTLKKDYIESGAIHVLAVSGLHIGIISSFLFFILNLLPIKGRSWNWVKLLATLTTIWGFALLTGMSASVLRAAIMFSIFSVSFILQRDTNRYNSLALAAFLILIMNPYALFEVGFQFSFLAVLGIFFFFPKLQEFWFPKNKWIYQIWLLLLVGISAQLAIFPLVLYYFHQVPTYFWLSGIIVVPLAGIIMKLGLCILFFNFLNKVLAKYLGIILTKIIATQNFLIGLIQELPFSVFSGFWVHQGELVLFYGIVLGFAFLLLTQRFRYILISLTCLLTVSCVQFSNKYQQFNQQKIIIYNISKQGLIDFIAGNTVYTLGQEKLADNQFLYTVQNLSLIHI